MEYVNDVSGELTNVLIAKDLSTSTDSYYLYGAGLISRGGVSEQNREYYLEDGTGSIRYLTDSNGNIVESYFYDPYGNSLSGDTPTGFAYKGEQIDTTTGLYFMRARYYNPATGSFVSRDPVEGRLTEPQTQNGYGFVSANPVNLSDPSGMVVGVDDAIAVCGAVAIAACKDGDCTNEARAAVVIADKIAGYTKHGINQAIGRDGGKGVSPNAIIDAVKNPQKVVEQVNGTMKYVGDQAVVVLNEAGKVITTWATSGEGVR